MGRSRPTHRGSRPLQCDCLGPATMIQRVVDDTHVYGHKAKLCGGMVPMSPCPCCTYCGFGPMGAKWSFVKAEGDAWIGEGSVFEGGCCVMCTNHNGDTFTFNPETANGTADKPMEMKAGMNPMNPPCFIGKKVLRFRMVADRKGSPVGGAPDAAEMRR